MQEMPDTASPSARNNPVVSASLIALALAAGVLTGVASGAVQDMLHGGFGRNDEILAEQRRHTQSIARIELAVSRVRTDIALLNERIGETVNRDQDTVNAAPGLRSDQPTPHNPTQSNLLQSDPEFDLGALRTSFEAEAVTLGARASRPHPRRAGKLGPDVRI
jgi:hypothetical protein